METITIINAKKIEEKPTLLPEGANNGNVDLTLEVTDYDMVRDGYHTINELYNHRIELYIAYCRLLNMKTNTPIPEGLDIFPVWRSKKHSDESSYDGWFILGIGEEKGKQISYHLPLARWGDTEFARTLEKAPEWDGHTSDDVVKRLKELL